MTAPGPTRAARTSGPSLYRLISDLPKERMLLQPADALVILGRQLELMVQDEQLNADVAIGTLRFSLFRLHQGRVAQLAPFCRSLTVYGDPDVEPPSIPGVEFVALQPGTPLSLEWFLLVDSPSFWGALLTQAVPDRTHGNTRRYLFEGTLTADERVVSRARLLLSLMERRPIVDHGQRDLLANRAHWGRIAHSVGSHGESQRLGLTGCLGEFPELVETLNQQGTTVEQLAPQALQALRRHGGSVGELLYRREGNLLHPLVWSGPGQPQPLDLSAGVAGQALQSGRPVLTALAPGAPEQLLLPEAHSLVAVPLHVGGHPWGVLMAGQSEVDPYESAVAPMAVGLAALLGALLTEHSLPQALPAFVPTPVETPWQAPPVPAAQPAPVSPPWQSPPVPAFEPTPGGPSWQAPPPVPAAQPAATTAPVAVVAAPANGFGLPAWMRSSAPLPTPPTPPMPAVLAQPGHDSSLQAMQKRLMGTLVAFDQRGAEHVWSEACSLYPTESICTDLLVPVQIAIGEGWHRGEVSVAAEHFSSRFVQGKLLSLLNAAVDNGTGPLAVVGCAQGELHEIGATMLGLFMRWSGFRVIYLGQNVPNTTIEETVRKLRPQVLGLSATTIEGAHNLTETGQILSRIEPPRPLFIFGGMAFYERPDLRSRIHGQFLEGDIRKIVRDLAEKLRK